MVPAKSKAPAGVSAALLGPPVIRCADKAVELLPERRYELLAYLAFHGTWLNRDALAFVFWPDQDNAGARRNLRWVLHSARDLPGVDAIEAERDRIRFDVATDVSAFEAAVREHRWRTAVELYAGPLCAGFVADGGDPFAQWLRIERARLAEQFHRAAISWLATADPQDAVTLAGRLIAEDPADEEALCAGVRALRELGQERDARHLYREFAERLMDDLGLEPGAETQALMREVEAPAAGPSTPVASPIESSFVGRQRELAEIAALLEQPECRLLTLIGPGGVGKSRLAREAIARLDGRTAKIVRLESLTVPGQVAGEVARTLGMRLRARDDSEAQVQAYLAEHPRLLLVFDNFEHLIDAAEQLGRWLAACRGLQAIVTSRERLGLAAEWLLPVAGLDVAREGSEPSAAARLFVERASAVRRGFESESETAHIARIVEQIEGMPLAIELAAAWTRLLPCAEIARDLASGLELLDGETAARPGQQGMRACFEHSWSLLMARERALLSRLAVFRGGFDREAARQIADGALPAIAQLVDKSLVRADGSGRFSLHPLLRQFGEEKLAATADDATARQRHAEYFAHWMERHIRDGRVSLATGMPLVEVEIGNCLATWDWAITHQRADLVRPASLVLGTYFEHRSPLREGLECLKRADALLPSIPGYHAAIGNVLRARATLTMHNGRYEEAERIARDSLRHFKMTHDPPGIKSALTTLGLSLWQRARYTEARR